MNVIVSNKYAAMLSSLSTKIDLIKTVDGEFQVDDLIAQFDNFFFNKMILDITAIKDYKDAIVNVCERWSIPVVDLYGNSGINPAIPSIKNNYFSDGIHPNSNGHERISEIICNELEDLYVGVKNEAIDNESYLMQYGNKFVSSFAEHNRASSVLNIYLEKGQTVTLIDNVNYQWALAGANSPTSTIKSHGYYPASAWSSIKSYVVEQSGYYGILLMKVDGTEFDFETSPESNNIYNYIIIE